MPVVIKKITPHAYAAAHYVLHRSKFQIPAYHRLHEANSNAEYVAYYSACI